VNSETVTLIERAYQGIVDDLLTAIVGGVVNEPILFDVKTDLYPLAEPAQGVRGITGTVEEAQHTFQPEVDFAFSEGDNAVVWQEGGTWPDDESTFYVDYFRRDSRSPLTDINVGSVTRTLSEAIGREIATVYQQINRAYLSAFVDTAEGKSLDLVVSILGVSRLTKDYARGQATFFRTGGSEGNITIREGASLVTKEGQVFRTSELRTLQRGQVRINVPIRAGDALKGEAGLVGPGEINELAQPIEGIDRVTNFEATYLGAEDESDEQLRARAKAAWRALGKGTLAALTRVIAENRASLTEAWDPNGPPAKRSEPGRVTLLVATEPELYPGLRGAVEETRAAGVQATLVARYVFFKPRMAVEISPGLTPQGKEKVIEEIIAAVQGYVDGLSSGDPAQGAELLSSAEEVEDVSEVTIVDVMAWRADVGQPVAEALVNPVMTAIQGAPEGDIEAQREAVAMVLAELPPLVPSGSRIPDRNLVQGPDGQRATDEQIEEGEFEVTATVDGESWWIVLDMEPADISIEES
jgi:hypothetical protein